MLLSSPKLTICVVRATAILEWIDSIKGLVKVHYARYNRMQERERYQLVVARNVELEALLHQANARIAELEALTSRTK